MNGRKAPDFLKAALAAALSALAACSSSGRPAVARSAADPPGDAAELVLQIRKADYEGNRPELARLFAAMAPYAEGARPLRARYWRGFAMWRRALNGFNDKADPAELASDLKIAIHEFEEALLSDPEFTDARIGDASCWGNLAYLTSGPDRMAGFQRHMELLKKAREEAPENPRLAWVQGATEFYTPAQIGGGQAKAIATYQAGLEAARRERVASPLDPSWGEPELLMNLAFSNLNRAEPDVAAAEKYARAALTLVPNWHYVRDILLPQIEAAERKTSKR